MPFRFDVNNICDAWHQILTPHPSSWHGGLDTGLLLEALFGMGTLLHFRCGACHSRFPHHDFVMTSQDLSLTDTQ